MTTRPPPVDRSRNDVRMDGVFFRRASAHGDFARTLDPGTFSYCVMIRSGRLTLEADFPTRLSITLEAGDTVSISGLVPHVFHRVGLESTAPPEPFEARPMAEAAEEGDVELVIGVAPNEALALGSLLLGPIVVRTAEHPDLSRRLWGAVAMLEDEYADAEWIDRDLVIRRLAEIMLVNLMRRVFAERRETGAEARPETSSRGVLSAINAFLHAPERAWTLADLARTAGMSRTRFAEEFRLVTGQTPGRVIARLRLTAAAHRLASERLSVEVAADEAGYSSSAAFVRAFQREFGETPARWRRRRRDVEPLRAKARGGRAASMGRDGR